jgi:hypothetical protein
VGHRRGGERTQPPDRIAFGGLDPEDVGAEIGEELGAEDGRLVGQVEDADAG